MSATESRHLVLPCSVSLPAVSLWYFWTQRKGLYSESPWLTPVGRLLQELNDIEGISHLPRHLLKAKKKSQLPAQAVVLSTSGCFLREHALSSMFGVSAWLSGPGTVAPVRPETGFGLLQPSSRSYRGLSGAVMIWEEPSLPVRVVWPPSFSVL